MVKIREKQTEQLEKAASKGLKLGGWKKMTLSSKIAAVVLVLVALTAILAPLLAPYSPVEIFTARQAPATDLSSVPTIRAATSCRVCFTVAVTR